MWYDITCNHLFFFLQDDNERIIIKKLMQKLERYVIDRIATGMVSIVT